MKRILFFAATVAFVWSFTSCSDKEGDFSPKEKISKIYTSSMYSSWYPDIDGEMITYGDTMDRVLSESGTWDGKQLSSITRYNYFDNYQYSEVVTFTYDGKQISRIDEEGMYSLITYNGKKLDKIEIYDALGTLEEAYTFTYDGKKISSIAMASTYNKMDKKAPSFLSTLIAREIFPEPKSIQRCIAEVRKSGAKETVTANLTWDGDNISSISVAQDGATATLSFTYDNKKNPYQHLLYNVYGSEDMNCFNENNITKCIISYSENGYTSSSEENYTYQYDGKWPTERTCNESFQYEEGGYSSSETTYFEYE